MVTLRHPSALRILGVVLLAGCQSTDEQASTSGGRQVESELAELRAEVLRVDALPRPQRLFEERCGICHGTADYHPATRQLVSRYGPGKGSILGRPELTPEAVKAIVRNGLPQMYPFRVVDLSDEDLDAIAGYVGGASQP